MRSVPKICLSDSDRKAIMLAMLRCSLLFNNDELCRFDIYAKAAEQISWLKVYDRCLKIASYMIRMGDPRRISEMPYSGMT